MSRPLLLDTHAAVWLALSDPLTLAARKALSEARTDRLPILVSPVSAWEIAMLVAKRRLMLNMDPAAWFSALLALPGLKLAELSPEILIASVSLPGSPPNDPMDRILLATARAHGLRLVTRDGLILAYAQEGFVNALAC